MKMEKKKHPQLHEAEWLDNSRCDSNSEENWRSNEAIISDPKIDS